MNGCVSSACETSSVVDTSGAVTRGGAEVPLVAVCDVLLVSFQQKGVVSVMIRNKVMVLT